STGSRARRRSTPLHRADELEVVVVWVGERGGGHRGCRGSVARFGGVGLLDDPRAGGLQLLEIALDVRGLDVPDDPARVRALALDLAVLAHGEPAGPDLPPGVAALAPGRSSEELRVVVHQGLRILAPDQHAVQVHAASFLKGSRPPGQVIPVPRSSYADGAGRRNSSLRRDAVDFEHSTSLGSRGSSPWPGVEMRGKRFRGALPTIRSCTPPGPPPP